MYGKVPKPKTCCQCIFSALKTALKNEQTCENTNNIQNIKTADNIAKSSQHQELLLVVLHGMIIGLKLHRKQHFSIQIGRYFQCGKNEFGQQVWVLGIFQYRNLAILKTSRQFGADRSGTPLLSLLFR